MLGGDGWMPHPGPVTVTVTPPLRPAGRGWPEMVRLRDTARAAIAAHCGEPVVSRSAVFPGREPIERATG
jgi:hypothetical protein